MHTQTALADWLVTSKKAHYLFFVKANQRHSHRAVTNVARVPGPGRAQRVPVREPTHTTRAGRSGRRPPSPRTVITTRTPVAHTNTPPAAGATRPGPRRSGMARATFPPRTRKGYQTGAPPGKGKRERH